MAEHDSCRAAAALRKPFDAATAAVSDGAIRAVDVWNQFLYKDVFSHGVLSVRHVVMTDRAAVDKHINHRRDIAGFDMLMQEARQLHAFGFTARTPAVKIVDHGIPLLRIGRG